MEGNLKDDKDFNLDLQTAVILGLIPARRPAPAAQPEAAPTTATTAASPDGHAGTQIARAEARP